MKQASQEEAHAYYEQCLRAVRARVDMPPVPPSFGDAQADSIRASALAERIAQKREQVAERQRAGSPTNNAPRENRR